MHYRSRIQSFNRKKLLSPSLLTIFFLLSFFIFSSGCRDSKPVTSPVLPLTDTTMILFQDGDGEWTVLDETDITATGIFTPDVTDTQGRYSIAFIRVYGEDQEVNIITMQATIAELPEIDLRYILDDDDIGTATLAVSVEESSLPDSALNIFYQGNASYSNISSGRNLTSFGLEAGFLDLVVTQSESTDRYPSTLLSIRDLELVADETLELEITTGDLAASVELSGVYTFTLLDQSSGNPIDSNLYDGVIQLLTSNRTFVDLGEKYHTDDYLEYTALGTPLTGLDTYMMDLDIVTGVNHALNYYVVLHDEGDKELSLTLDEFGLSFKGGTGTGTLLPGMTIPDIEGVTAIGYSVYFSGNSNGISYYAMGLISAARQTGTSFIMPDLSSVKGWDNRWSIPVNVEFETTWAYAYIGPENFLNQARFTYYFMEDNLGKFYQDMEDGDWVAVLRENIYYGKPR